MSDGVSKLIFSRIQSQVPAALSRSLSDKKLIHVSKNV